MSNYNPYSDHRAFTGKIDLMGEVVPAKSWFETYPNELCFYQETEPMPYPAVINHVATNHITPLDMHIICIVATLTFVTTKQINDCLTMLEIPHSETNVKSSVERLARHQMLRMSHFGVDAEHCCKFYVYSLNKNGADIAKVRGISSSFTPMQPATAPADMKRILVQNQAWLSFIKSGLNLDYLKRSEIITAKEEKTAVVRPSIALSMDNDPMFIEIVRKGDFWERYLIDKLIRYKTLFDNWASNSWGIDNSPLLILNGENEEHNHRILALASDVGLEDLYFTEDTLLCGSQFYHSIYQFHDNGQHEFFCFDQPAIDVA